MTKRPTDLEPGKEPRWRGVELSEGPAPRSRDDSQPGDRSRSSRGSGAAGRSRSLGGWVIAGLVIALLVLHQDSWFWEDGRLVWGIFPVGLFWHICLSIAATLTWALATKIAWPLDDPETPEEAR